MLTAFGATCNVRFGRLTVSFKSLYSEGSVLALALLSPALTYLLDLRLAQVIGPQSWLDDFRILQIPLIAAFVASSVFLPQIVVPKAAAITSDSIDWNFIKRIQIQVLVALFVVLVVANVEPERLICLLNGPQAHTSNALIESTRAFTLAIVITVASGLNASCLMAAGNAAWVYTISTGPTLGTLCGIQMLGRHSGLVSISMCCLGGTLLVYFVSSGALLKRYLGRECKATAKTVSAAKTFGAQDLQIAGALIANSLSAVVLNRKLADENSVGVVSTFNFALKIVSVVTVPCLFMANRLLGQLSNRGMDTSQRLRIAGKSALLCSAYALLTVVLVRVFGNSLVHVIFFRAKFTHDQYDQVTSTLRTLVFGLPAVAQAYIWMRFNAMENLTRFTLAGAGVTLGFSSLISFLQPKMDLSEVAMAWTISMSLQSVILLLVRPVVFLGTLRLRIWSNSVIPFADALVLIFLSGSMAAAAAQMLHTSQRSALLIVGLCNLFCLFSLRATAVDYFFGHSR